jgi:hypothetical protein
MSFRSFWNWFVGRIWKSLEKWVKESLECSKWSLKDDSVAGSSEDQNQDRNADSINYAHEGQMGTRTH